MNGAAHRWIPATRRASIVVGLFFLPPLLLWCVDFPGFKPGFNLFSTQQDVQLGKESAEEVDETYLLLVDPQTLRYLNDLGRRLSSLAPGNSPEYVWKFKVIDSSDINAMALPGGYVYVNRGSIEGAENEAQLAGVLAHEIGHVVMRHGTHEASQALLARAPLALLENILGRSASLTGQLTKLGLELGVNSILLKNSRSAELEADAVGTYTLVRAGYDPHAMAEFFEIMGKRYPRQTAQFFSDHPNPEDRAKRIEDEKGAAILVEGQPIRWKSDSPEFAQAKERLRSLPAPPRTAVDVPALAASPGPPPAPSSKLARFDANGFSISYPENWRVQLNEDSVTIVPLGGIVEVPESGPGQAYGASVSRFQPQQANWGLVDATQELLDILRLSNPNLRVIEQRSLSLKGRSALSTLFESDSPLQGQKERDLLITARQSDFMFSLIFIAPQSQFDAYKPTFDVMLQSLELR